jgi:hypothetical protein
MIHQLTPTAKIHYDVRPAQATGMGQNIIIPDTIENRVQVQKKISRISHEIQSHLRKNLLVLHVKNCPANPNDIILQHVEQGIV